MARAGVDTSGAEFLDVVRQRLLASVTAFYAVLEGEALLRVERDDLEGLRTSQGITERLVGVGGAGTIEADRVRVAVLDREIEVRKREADVSAAKALLLAELGRTEPIPGLRIEGSLAVERPAPPPPLDEAFDLAQQARPDVASARLRIAQAEAALRSERSKAYPELTPRVGYTRQFQESSIGFPDVSAWGASIEMSLPVFDRNQGNVAKADSERRRAEVELKTRLAEVRWEVADAAAHYAAAYATVTSDTSRRIEAARAARDKIQAAYKLGARPLIDVLDAQRALRDTLRLDVLERAAFWKSLYALNAAVGKEIVK